METIVEELDRVFDQSIKKFSSESLKKFLSLLDLVSVQGSELHIDPLRFQKYWSHFNSDSTENLVIAIANVINTIVFYGGVVISFDDPVKLQSFLLRLIQIVQRQKSSIQLKVSIINAISSLIMNLSDRVTRTALAPLFSILTWKEFEFANFFNKETIEEFNLQKSYNSELEKYNQLKGKPKIVHDILSSYIINLINEFISHLHAENYHVALLIEILNQFSIMLSQLPTRRYTKSLFDLNIVLSIAKSKNYKDIDYLHSVKVFEYFLKFPINEFNGELISEEQQSKELTDRITRFQILASTKYQGEFDSLLFGNIIFNETDELLKELLNIDTSIIEELLLELKLRHTDDTRNNILIEYFQKPETPKEFIGKFSSLPNINSLKNIFASPLFNINQQYLSIDDFLVRNYLKTRHSIFNDILNHILKTSKRFDINTHTNNVKGSSKYGIKISNPEFLGLSSITSKELNYSTFSEASLKIDPNHFIHDNPISLKNEDILFFVQISKDFNKSQNIELNESIGIIDILPATIIDISNSKESAKSNTIKVRFDTNSLEKEELNKFNILIRLPDHFDSKFSSLNLNKFKLKLDFILKFLDFDIHHDWLLDMVLGYGCKDLGSWKNFNKNHSISIEDFNISTDLLKIALPEFDLIPDEPQTKKRKINQAIESNVFINSLSFEGDSYSFSLSSNKKSDISLNKEQARAIIESSYEGLTLVNGPNGTGKKYVASLISKSNFTNNEKTLVLSKNPSTLTELFENFDKNEKFINLDDDIENLLNLLDSKITESFTILNRFILDLNIENYLIEDQSTLIFFRSNYIESKWNEYSLLISDMSNEEIIDNYPFKNLLEFNEFIKGFSEGELVKSITEHYLKIIKTIWETETLLSISTMKNDEEKIKYLLLTLAKVIGATESTFENYMKDIGDYENVIILQATKFDDFETLNSVLFKESVKKITLFGDAKTQSPGGFVTEASNITHLKTIYGSAISLFEKFIRNGVPSINFHEVYNTRSEVIELTELKLNNNSQAAKRNPGLLHNVQIVKVEGKQVANSSNVDEAEFAIQFYNYLISINYPEEKIAIVTTTSIQAILIQEIAKKKLQLKPKVLTVIEANGLQFDYVIVSLVGIDELKGLNSKLTTGLILNATKGLYLLAEHAIISDLYKNSKKFKKLIDKSTKLEVVKNEKYESDTSQTVQKLSIFSIENTQQLIKHRQDLKYIT